MGQLVSFAPQLAQLVTQRAVAVDAVAHRCSSDSDMAAAQLGRAASSCVTPKYLSESSSPSAVDRYTVRLSERFDSRSARSSRPCSTAQNAVAEASFCTHPSKLSGRLPMSRNNDSPPTLPRRHAFSTTPAAMTNADVGTD